MGNTGDLALTIDNSQTKGTSTKIRRPGRHVSLNVLNKFHQSIKTSVNSSDDPTNQPKMKIKHHKRNPLTGVFHYKPLCTALDKSNDKDKSIEMLINKFSLNKKRNSIMKINKHNEPRYSNPEILISKNKFEEIINKLPRKISNNYSENKLIDIDVSGIAPKYLNISQDSIEHEVEFAQTCLENLKNPPKKERIYDRAKEEVQVTNEITDVPRRRSFMSKITNYGQLANQQVVYKDIIGETEVNTSSISNQKNIIGVSNNSNERNSFGVIPNIHEDNYNIRSSLGEMKDGHVIFNQNTLSSTINKFSRQLKRPKARQSGIMNIMLLQEQNPINEEKFLSEHNEIKKKKLRVPHLKSVSTTNVIKNNLMTIRQKEVINKPEMETNSKNLHVKFGSGKTARNSHVNF